MKSYLWIRQQTELMDIIEHMAKHEWCWAEHVALRDHNRWSEQFYSGNQWTAGEERQTANTMEERLCKKKQLESTRPGKYRTGTNGNELGCSLRPHIVYRWMNNLYLEQLKIFLLLILK